MLEIRNLVKRWAFPSPCHPPNMIKINQHFDYVIPWVFVFCGPDRRRPIFLPQPTPLKKIPGVFKRLSRTFA